MFVFLSLFDHELFSVFSFIMTSSPFIIICLSLSHPGPPSYFMSYVSLKSYAPCRFHCVASKNALSLFLKEHTEAAKQNPQLESNAEPGFRHLVPLSAPKGVRGSQGYRQFFWFANFGCKII